MQTLIHQIKKLNLVRLDTHPSTHLLIVSCEMKLVIGYGIEPFYKTGIDCQSLLVGHNLGNSNYREVGLFTIEEGEIFTMAITNNLMFFDAM